MDGHESLTQVKRLLGLLPGVELAWARHSPAGIRLGLVVRDPRSLALLSHISRAANVPLHVEVDWDCQDLTGSHDDPECLRYDLRVPVETASDEPPSVLQIVGGLLARRLKERGLLDPIEADQLLRAWHFAIESLR